MARLTKLKTSPSYFIVFNFSFPFTIGEGDCQFDSECAGDLICGEKNCQDFDSAWPRDPFGFYQSCCKVATEMDKFCNSTQSRRNCCEDSRPCNIGEGGCNSDSHCAGDLICGIWNCKDFDSAWPDKYRCCKVSTDDETTPDLSGFTFPPLNFK